MIRIYNTEAAEKQNFEPLEKNKVRMYVCGPTVYDSAHLGHGRSAVAFDVIRRYLLYAGYDVTYVMNYTDIDDKMINRAADEGITVPELAAKVIPEYERDYGALGIMVPDILPLATDHVEEMVDLVKTLEEKGYAYVLDDGVYFDVSKYEDYGEFSGQNLEELQMGARVDVKESKRTPFDFVLWKFKKEGEPSWGSPWGEGRPGWHIECSAMTWKHLGETFDIHGGGLDLTFPHHECEVAQSRGCFGAGTFAKYWLHNGFINVDNTKMSKSLGNFFTLKDIFEKYDPKIVRFMFLQTHYRNPVNFSDVLLDQAKAGLARLHDFVRKLRSLENLSSELEINADVLNLLEKSRAGFEASMNDDFDTSGALGSLFELVRAVNILIDGKSLVQADLDEIMKFLEALDTVFGVIFFEEDEIDADVESLIKEREQARADKNWGRSDEIRDELLARGIVLEDTSEGTVWKKG
jgi:cysteinyl-tRNA synthetase